MSHLSSSRPDPPDRTGDPMTIEPEEVREFRKTCGLFKYALGEYSTANAKYFQDLHDAGPLIDGDTYPHHQYKHTEELSRQVTDLGMQLATEGRRLHSSVAAIEIV